jgi:hypothetical protein
VHRHPLLLLGAEVTTRVEAAAERLRVAMELRNEVLYERALRELEAARAELREQTRGDRDPCTCTHPRVTHLTGRAHILGCVSPGCQCITFEEAS